MKKLSVYIPTYNRKEHLKRQLEFIFSDAEEYLSEIEVIVSDNASDDGTNEMAKAMQEKYPFAYYRNEKNLGIVTNALLSSEYCKGEFLWLIGDDDYIERGVIKKLFQIFTAYPDVNFIFLDHANMYGKVMDYGYSYPVVPPEFCTGYFENALPLVMNNFEVIGPQLVLTTAHLLRREIWNKTTDLLPCTAIESYGLNMVAPLAAIKMGKSYFDPEISTYGNYANFSWRKEAFQSFYGTQMSILKLKDLGYAENEIVEINRALLERNLALLNELRREIPDLDEEKVLQFENYLLQSANHPLKRLSKRETRILFPYLDFFKNKRVVIYGAGRIGNALHQTCMDHGIEVAAWCDRNYRQLQRDGKKVDAPEIIADLEFDLVLDAVGDPSSLEDIFNLMASLGVDKSRIKVTIPEYRMIIQ